MFNITPIRPDYSAPKAAAPDATKLAADLRAAAATFRAARQSNNELTCADMASRIAKFGATEKQVAFAAVLIERAAKLATPVAQAPAVEAPVQRVNCLFGVMQKHSHFYVGDVTLARKNQDSLVWIKHAHADKVIGKIVDGKVSLFLGRMSVAKIDPAAVEDLLNELEANPLLAAVKYGKLSGRCCSCGRDLTDPESIEAGIGPVCVLKFNA